ncbi:MAG: YcfL family protein [Colwelliaceae bacterium]|nr:YcfL family protein [Colwelliaceae bacterium]
MLMVAFGLSACHKPIPVTSGLGAESITNEIPPATYLKVDNEALSEKLTISDVKHRMTNDLLEINIELSSQYEKSLKLQYHFNWFDKNGFVVEINKASWQPLELHGHQSKILRGVSPSSNVTSFNVYVRSASSNAYKN